jgi:hypothetical protein
MEFPVWAIFALLCAASSALVLILPEQLKCDGFALAFWNKVSAVVFMAPLVLYAGMPENPIFYALVALQAMLWVVSDVIFFRALPVVGAGVVSRILPASVIMTFCLWFLFDPALLSKYLETPVRSGLIFAALLGSVYFAMRLKKCAVTWQAVRMIWFVLFAAVVGPLIYKLVTREAPIEQGPFAFVFFEGLVMISLWSVYYAWKKPVGAEIIFSRQALKAGAMVGGALTLVSLTKFAAMHYVDNPGLVPAVKYLDAIIVMGYYRMIGHVEKADVAAGLGIVVCAAGIILLRM